MKTTEGNQNIIIVILFWYTDFMSVSIFLSIFSFIHHLFMVLTYLLQGCFTQMQMGMYVDKSNADRYGYVLKIGNKGNYLYLHLV